MAHCSLNNEILKLNLITIKIIENASQNYHLETFTYYSVTLHNSDTNLQNTQNIQQIYLK
jgi:hypothetical protein